MSNPKDIVITRSLTDEQIAYTRRIGLNPLIVPAIHVDPDNDRERIVRKLDQHSPADWIFTSRNGAGVFADMLEAEESVVLPNRIYAVGDKTAGIFQEKRLDVRTPERQDAVGLAELIIREYPEPARFVHWCGNRSRSELKVTLNRAGMELIRMEVYQTHLNSMILPGSFGEAVLFFSPSAVEAFRKSGGFDRELPELFAIGSTTGEALGLESGKNVHIPSKPSTEALLDLVAGFLKANGDS